MRALYPVIFALVAGVGLCCEKTAGAEATPASAIVRRGPSLNGGFIEGSLQVLSGNTFAINSGFQMTGDLLLPGSPNLVFNGTVQREGVIAGSGAIQPVQYQVLFNGGVSLGYIVTRTDPVEIPTVSEVPNAAGNRNVVINQPGQSPGDFATLRNLTLNSNAGIHNVPPGDYGNFTASSNTGFRLGVAGSVMPVTYNFQKLTLNSSSVIEIVGPVVIRLKNTLSLNGTIGSSGQSDIVWVESPNSGITLNSGGRLYANVLVPGGRVVINSNAILEGSLECDQFTLNSNGVLRLLSSDSRPTANSQNLTTAIGASLPITLTGSDPDGDPLTYSVTSNPGNGSVSGTAPDLTYTPGPGFTGADSFTFEVSDGVQTSAPATISITVVLPPLEGEPDFYLLNEGSTLVVAAPGVLQNDPATPGGQLTAELGAAPGFGSLQFGIDGSFTYQPDSGYFGDDVFTYRPVASGFPGELTPVTLYVNALPRPENQSYAVPQNQPLNVLLEAFDPDDSVLEFSLLTTPTLGILLGDPSDTIFEYIPNWQASGTDGFTFSVTDPLNASATGTIALTLNPSNAPPVAMVLVERDSSAAPFTASFDGQSSYDIDGTIVLYEWDFDVDGTIDATGPVSEFFSPEPGNLSVRLVVTDNSGGKGVATIDLFMNNSPTARIASPRALAEFVEGESIVVVAEGADSDGAVAGLELLVDGDLVANVTGGWGSFDLGGLPAGEHTLSIRATDDRGAFGLSTGVPITVFPSLASTGSFVVHPNLRVAELPAVPGSAEGGVDGVTTTLPLFADNYFTDAINYTVELLNNKTSGETGYLVLDSETSAEVDYVWEEISAIGLKLEATLYDDGYSAASLSFPFPFFDQSFDRVFVGSNGLLGFVEESFFWMPNSQIPNPSTPGYLIAAFWTDLLPGLEFEDQYSGSMTGASAIYGKDFGDKFIIQYSADADFWGPLGSESDPEVQAPENNPQLGVVNFNRTGRYTFQIVLHQNGDIDFVYRWMAGATDLATLGIQNGDGTDGLQVAFNEPFVTNHRTIRLKRELRGAPWFTLENVSGSLPVGGHDEMAVRFFSRPDFPTGVHAGQIRVDHDQPDLPPYFVDVGLNIFPKDPAVDFVQPQPGGRQYYFDGEEIPLQIEASDEDGVVRSVWVTANGVQLASWTSGPFTFQWSPPVGEYFLVAHAIDNDGRVSASEPLWVSFSVDLDGNGLPDAFELEYFGGLYGLDPLEDWDGDGLTIRKELWLGLNPVVVDPITVPNLPPVARLVTERLSGEAPIVVRFNAASSYDLDGAVVEWRWDFNGDGVFDSSSPQVEWTFANVGQFPVTLLVFDDEGEADAATVSIRVRPAGTAIAPVAAFDASLYAAPAARVIGFDATASTDPDGTIESYSWDFGDGTTSIGPTPSHYYDRTGIHPVRLTVTDEDGLTSSIEKFVTITHADRGVFDEQTGFLVLEAEHATTFDPRNDRFAWRLSRSRFQFGDWGAQLEYAGDDFRASPPDDPVGWEDAAEIGWRVRINTPGEYFYAARYTTSIRDPFGSLRWRVGVDGVEVGPPDGDPIGHSESAIRWRRGVSLGYLEAGDHTIQIRRAGDLVWLDQIAIALNKEALPENQTVSAGLPGSIRPNLPVSPPTARISSTFLSAELPVEVLLDGSLSSAARGEVVGYNWVVERTIDPATGLPQDGNSPLGTSQSIAVEIDDFNHPGERGEAFGPDGVEVELHVVDSFGQVGETGTYISLVDPLESIASPVEITVDDTSSAFSAGPQWHQSQQFNDFIQGNYYPGGVDEFFAQLNISPPPFTAIPLDRLELRDWFGTEARFNFTDSTDVASFAPDLPATSDYLVFVRWPRTNRSLEPYIDPISGESVAIAVDDAAIVTVDGVNGSAKYIMDQRLGGGHWRFVGVHAFNSGNGGSISIQPSQAHNVTLVDAVRFLGADGSPGNQAPVSVFSFSVGEDGTAAFDGSLSSDSDGTIIAWFWEFGDGKTRRAKRPSHHYTTFGNHAVTLTVIDDQLGFHKVSQTLNVPTGAPGESPVARISLNAIRGEVPFVLEADASLSTDDTGMVRYRWDTVLEDEPWGGVTPFSAHGEQASFVFNKPGTYPVTLTVTDENGVSDTTALTIETVARGVSTQWPFVVDNRDLAVEFDGGWLNHNPSIGQPWPGELGERSNLIAGLTHGSDFAYASQVGDEVVFKPSLPHAGLYQVFLRYPVPSIEPPLRVRVQHSGGESSVDYNHGIHAGDWQLLGTFLFGGGSQGSLSFSKDRVNQAVFADAVRWVPVAGATKAGFTTSFTSGSVAPAVVAFDASSSTSDVGIASYLWDFGDGMSGQGATVNHTYSEKGTYAVRLSVTDNRGASASSTRFVRVSATLTPPNAAADVTPLGGSRPLVVGFDGSASSDPDGIVSYHWDLGDGQTFSGPTGSHRYDRPGTYGITLTVTDTLGSSAQVARTVQVDDVSSLLPPRLNVANVDPSAGVVQFDAGGLPPGASVTWDFGDGLTGTGPSASHQYTHSGSYHVVLSVDSGGQVSTVSRWIAVGEVQIPPDAPRSDPGAAFILYTPLAPTP